MTKRIQVLWAVALIAAATALPGRAEAAAHVDFGEIQGSTDNSGVGTPSDDCSGQDTTLAPGVQKQCTIAEIGSQDGGTATSDGTVDGQLEADQVNTDVVFRSLVTTGAVDAFARFRDPDDPNGDVSAAASVRTVVNLDVVTPTVLEVIGTLSARRLSGAAPRQCSEFRILGLDIAKDAHFVATGCNPTPLSPGITQTNTLDEQISLLPGLYQMEVDARAAAEGTNGNTERSEASFGLSVVARECENEFTDGDDSDIVGTEDDDVLCGGDGNDTIQGLGGNDRIYGDFGNDDVQGGDGIDELFGGRGLDSMRGGANDDTIEGGGDNDTIAGDLFDFETPPQGFVDGTNTVRGGPGNDQIEGGLLSDALAGDDGDDFIDGMDNGDQISGGLGNDTLRGSGEDPFTIFDGRDTINGGPGDDFIRGGEQKDTLIGGAGSDKLRGEQGPDVLIGGGRKDVLNGGEQNDCLKARDGVLDNVIGGPGGNDKAVVDGQDNVFSTTELLVNSC